jgi:hypothetical protein
MVSPIVSILYFHTTPTCETPHPHTTHQGRETPVINFYQPTCHLAVYAAALQGPKAGSIVANITI